MPGSPAGRPQLWAAGISILDAGNASISGDASPDYCHMILEMLQVRMRGSAPASFYELASCCWTDAAVMVQGGNTSSMPNIWRVAACSNVHDVADAVLIASHDVHAGADVVLGHL